MYLLTQLLSFSSSPTGHSERTIMQHTHSIIFYRLRVFKLFVTNKVCHVILHWQNKICLNTTWPLERGKITHLQAISITISIKRNTSEYVAHIVHGILCDADPEMDKIYDFLICVIGCCSLESVFMREMKHYKNFDCIVYC